MPDPAAFVARARKVLAKATPGPLYAESDPGADCPECDAPQQTEAAVVRSKATTGGVAIVMEDDRAEANTDIYVLAVNSLPALLDVVEAVTEYKRARSRNDGHDGPAYEIDADVERTERALFLSLARLEVPE